MWFLKLLGVLGDVIQWIIGFGQRQIGREQQQNDDKTKTIKQLEAELNAASQRPDVDKRLSDHTF